MAPETPKGVSSRLLSMKFMQRAAASASSTPGSDTEAPSSKKRKLGHDSFSADIDQASIQAAIDERESKRKAALEKHGASDTHWVLNSDWDKKSVRTRTQPVKVVYVGYGDLDPSDDESESNQKPCRTSTKDYRSDEAAKNGQGKSESEGEPSDESDENEEAEYSAGDSKGRANGESPSSRQSRSRSPSRSNSKQREASKAKQFREKRKKKEVQLNKLNSISSAGAAQLGSPGSQSSRSMACYTCQQPGHKASDCPNKQSKGSSKRG